MATFKTGLAPVAHMAYRRMLRGIDQRSSGFRRASVPGATCPRSLWLRAIA